ncbi:hypothetical protein FF125_16080 [Aureibaculum algae]|uniref:Uncharacterized protein n=1 Tax=Aureibaculum algae TaxID=2584122 RepID=A0A5B7TXB2_9FLAO|nr:hypothetical protein FF125_16080 [Aureibaculum algae]
MRLWQVGRRTRSEHFPKPLAKSFVFCFYLYFLKAKSKDLADLVSKPKPLNIVLSALFAIGIVVISSDPFE